MNYRDNHRASIIENGDPRKVGVGPEGRDLDGSRNERAFPAWPRRTLDSAPPSSQRVGGRRRGGEGPRSNDATRAAPWIGTWSAAGREIDALIEPRKRLRDPLRPAAAEAAREALPRLKTRGGRGGTARAPTREIQRRPPLQRHPRQPLDQPARAPLLTRASDSVGTGLAKSFGPATGHQVGPGGGAAAFSGGCSAVVKHPHQG